MPTSSGQLLSDWILSAYVPYVSYVVNPFEVYGFASFQFLPMPTSTVGGTLSGRPFHHVAHDPATSPAFVGRASKSSSSWTVRIIRAARPPAIRRDERPGTSIIARLMMSAAVPWIGMLTAALGADRTAVLARGVGHRPPPAEHRLDEALRARVSIVSSMNARTAGKPAK